MMRQIARGSGRASHPLGTRLLNAAAFVAAALILIACGSHNSTTPGGQAAVTPASGTGPIVKIVIPPPPGPGETLVTIAPRQARTMTIADVLRQDERFTVFRQLAEQTLTSAPGRPSWLELWHRPASSLGDNHDGYTVFVPTEEAFSRLEPVLRDALADGKLRNAERYWLLGYHGVHRLFPSSEFRNGPAGSWDGDVEIALDPLTYGGQPIMQTDMQVANGYIHVIDGVVVPDLVMQRAGTSDV